MSAPPSCRACRDAPDFAASIRMAFQPIVDLAGRRVYAWEALVRGHDGAPAAQVLAGIDERNRYAFDQACRVKAIESAQSLDAHTPISINFMPRAVYSPEHCLRATLAIAERCRRPLQSIILEVSEQEHLHEPERLLEILRSYRRRGLRVAIDDFGAGHSGLGLLADFQPDLLKLDMALVRGIDHDRPRRLIAAHIARLARELGVQVVAEGVETAAEARTLSELGIDLQQGFLYARPQLGAIPAVRWPAPGAAPP